MGPPHRRPPIPPPPISSSVVDGDLLPVPPIEAIAGGAAADVDVLVGTNSDEYRFFLVPSGMVDPIGEPELRTVAAGYGLDPDEAVAAYRAEGPDASPGDLPAALTTDWFYRLPAIRLAEARTGHTGATYVYEFAWQPPTFDGRLGACHAAEIPFVFGNLHDPALTPLLGDRLPRQVADAMHHARVSFATDGDPGWPAYDTRHRTTMRFDTVSAVRTDPRPRLRSLWDGHRQAPFTTARGRRSLRWWPAASRWRSPGNRSAPSPAGPRGRPGSSRPMGRP
ncbi:hypothetical protein SSPO_083150 [Streptomyces antimycoticus]|uniref:Carboxylesterase type B domain-containing protein n=1 Tax=Streptomyces antimycoticus TaxID=68175 RepID=A0A499VHF7_9ACTN|nr:carboxylesterase family protein [Streptomyces antimycoticus]BBJ45597.1 hypothetical protein SSPO_083150 [Streptomyces antimycoticus]